MTRDRSNRSPPAHTYPTRSPLPARALPSASTIAVLAALPVAVVVAASFPTATVTVAATLVGVAVGVGLQRRWPETLDRAVPVADRGARGADAD